MAYNSVLQCDRNEVKRRYIYAGLFTSCPVVAKASYSSLVYEDNGCLPIAYTFSSLCLNSSLGSMHVLVEDCLLCHRSSLVACLVSLAGLSYLLTCFLVTACDMATPLFSKLPYKGIAHKYSVWQRASYVQPEHRQCLAS